MPPSIKESRELTEKKAERARQIAEWEESVPANENFIEAELKETERQIFLIKRKNEELQEKIDFARHSLLTEDEDEGIIINNDEYHGSLMEEFDEIWEEAAEILVVKTEIDVNI